MLQMEEMLVLVAGVLLRLTASGMRVVEDFSALFLSPWTCPRRLKASTRSRASPEGLQRAANIVCSVQACSVQACSVQREGFDSNTDKDMD